MFLSTERREALSAYVSSEKHCCSMVHAGDGCFGFAESEQEFFL